MNISLIISVYKDVDSLRTVLDGLQFQTFRDFQIVISEDGESEVMADFVAKYSFKHPVVHATQKDEGWRKNRALNNAVRKAGGDYLVFIDGDCVLHHKFMENHRRFAQPQRILAGKRVKMGPDFTDLFKKGIHDLPTLEKKVSNEKRKMIRDGAKFYEEAFYISPDGLF